MQFVRRDAGRYYLHQVDRDYALSRIPNGQPGDRDATSVPFTSYGLRHQAAEYFGQIRTPRATWKRLDDLAPQLAEFELRCQGEDYNAAAVVLLGMDFDHLLLWGHYRLVVDLHERLQGKLTDPDLEQASTGNLGTALWQMGQYRRAIACLEQALAIVRELEDRQSEAAWLGNLGNCYANLGEYLWAIDLYEQALVTDRELGNREGEARNLGNLGSCYLSVGKVRRAIDLYEQTLLIAREFGNRQAEGMHLGNLGLCYLSLGHVGWAIDLNEQVLTIARELSDREGEAIALSNLGDCGAARNLWDQAIQRYNEAIRIADEIGLIQVQSEARSGLARARLFQGELSAAGQAAEAARAFDYPINNAKVAAALGVILLRQGDRKPAKVAFTAAVAEADALLLHTSDSYPALDTKALALCGLALLGDADRLPEAIAAIQAARALTQAAGVVRDARRLLDALAVADHDGILGPARAAADPAAGGSTPLT
jgi:tetratricopeptide (TPR) repeat protein